MVVAGHFLETLSEALLELVQCRFLRGLEFLTNVTVAVMDDAVCLLCEAKQCEVADDLRGCLVVLAECFGERDRDCELVRFSVYLDAYRGRFGCHIPFLCDGGKDPATVYTDGTISSSGTGQIPVLAGDDRWNVLVSAQPTRGEHVPSEIFTGAGTNRTNVLVAVLAPVFVVIAIVLWGAAIVAWRDIDSPAVDLFAVVTGTVGTGSLVIAVGFAAADSLLVLGSIITVGMVIPIPWVMFAFDYVGKEKFVSTRVAAVLAAPIVLGLSATIAIFAGQLFEWFTLPSQTTATGVAAVFITVMVLSQWIGLLYAGGLTLAGTGLILWTFQRYEHLDTTTGIVLCSFGIVPWVSILFGLQLESVSFFALGGTVAVGFAVGGLAAVALVGPSQLFRRVPAAGSVGPTRVIEELEDGIIITDEDGRIVELNRSASRLLNEEGPSLGRPIESTLEMDLSGLRDDTVIELESESGRILCEPKVSNVTDQHGNPLGYAVLLRDVTTRTTRQQRLAVLNRLLRHNLRNDMSIIIGYAQVIENQIENPAVQDRAAHIAETGSDLVDLSDRARKTVEVLESTEETERLMPLAPLVDELIRDLEEDHDIEFSYQDLATVAVPVPHDRLRLGLRSVIESSIQRTDRESGVVEIRTNYRPEETYELEISVLDNGAPIPEQEREVIETGGETSLEHTSGVSLWTTRWITNSVGGKLSFDHREPRGTVVTLALPTAEPVSSLPSRQLVGAGKFDI